MAGVPVHGMLLRAAFTAGGKQLWIAEASQRMLLIDATTGKVLKILDPLRFIPYFEMLSAMCFFIWAFGWVRFAAKVHRHAWLDCAWLTGLCIVYIIQRTRLTGFADEVTRPINQFAEGIFASWLILASLWLVQGRTRLSLRILPEIAVAGLSVLIALICVGFENTRVWEFIIAMVLMCLWLIIACLPLRWMGYRLLRVGPSAADEDVKSSPRGVVSIRDLLLLTTVLAGLISVGQLVPPSMQVTFQLVANLFVMVISVTLTGVFAVRFGLSQRSFAARLASLVFAAFVAMALPFAWTAVNQGRQATLPPDSRFLWWQIRLHTSTALVTSVCLYTFRLRGWRMARSSAS